MSTPPPLKASTPAQPPLISPGQRANGKSSAHSTAARTISDQHSSDRICIGIAVEISGTDVKGQDFLERTKTEHISRNGACVILNRFLAPDQQLIVQRKGSRKAAPARVVGQVGIRPQGHVYGLVLADPDPSFWGVRFPPVADEPTAFWLKCNCCLRQESADLNEIEAGVLEANGVLFRACGECGVTTLWQAVPEEDLQAAAASSPARKPNRRRSLRTTMKTFACICQPSGWRDIVTVLDVSRGGISFRSVQNYPIHSWVELAVPYTEGGANIFVPGRIVWERPSTFGFREYGVQYVKS
jgi:PilZ domain-containing protein